MEEGFWEVPVDESDEVEVGTELEIETLPVVLSPQLCEFPPLDECVVGAGSEAAVVVGVEGLAVVVVAVC